VEGTHSVQIPKKGGSGLPAEGKKAADGMIERRTEQTIKLSIEGGGKTITIRERGGPKSDTKEVKKASP